MATVKRAAIGLLVALLGAGAAGPAAAQTGCYGDNYGAFWQGHSGYVNRGVRADVDHEAADPPGSDRVIFHPLQVDLSGVEFVGFGTYKGDYTGGNPHCPTDNTGWNVYVDGNHFGDYFCQSLESWPEYTGGDDNIPFKIVFGNGCTFTNVFKFYTNGAHITCADFGTHDRTVSVGGEAGYGPGSVLHIDVHYDNIDRYNYQGNWLSLTDGDHCVDPGYRLRDIDPDNVWAEETP